MTTAINQYYENMTKENLRKQLDHLCQQYDEAREQWDIQCDLHKAGFDHLPEWEREGAKKGCRDRREFWFMQKEIAFKSWNEFWTFLNEKEYWESL